MNKLAYNMAKGAQKFAPAMPTASSNEVRAFYNFIKENYPDAVNYAINWRTVRSPQVLQDGQNEYQFPITTQDQTDPMALGIDQNDLFFPLFQTFNLFYREINSDGSILAAGQPYTYPNETVFTALQNKVLYNIYQGNYNLLVGSRRWIEKDPMQQYLNIPTIQKGVYLSEIDPQGQVLADPYEDQKTFRQVVPSVYLAGVDSIQATLSLKGFRGNALNFEAQDADYQNTIQFEMRGYMIKGGAKLLKGKEL